MTPSQVHCAYGIPPEILRVWRNRGLLDGIGSRANGRWQYSDKDVACIAQIFGLMDRGLSAASARKVVLAGKSAELAALLDGC